MYFLKVVCGGQLVDEEAVASLELASPFLNENNHDNGGATDNSDSRVSQLQNVAEKEMTQEEN